MQPAFTGINKLKELIKMSIKVKQRRQGVIIDHLPGKYLYPSYSDMQPKKKIMEIMIKSDASIRI